MLSRECEQTLSRAVACASGWQHESVTVEALLLALLDDPDTEHALLACGADIEALRSVTIAFLDQTSPRLERRDLRPEVSVQRIVERAEIHCQTAGRDKASGANLLVALFSEGDSKAASFLAEQRITRDDVVKMVLKGWGTPVLGRDLELTLRRAMALANARHHEEATLDHLLLALVDDPDASDALLKCGAELENLHALIAAHLDRKRARYPYEARPAVSLQQVVQRAGAHVRDLGRSEITGANVLVELLSESESWAVGCLAKQGIERLQVVSVIVEQRHDLKEPR